MTDKPKGGPADRMIIHTPERGSPSSKSEKEALICSDCCRSPALSVERPPLADSSEAFSWPDHDDGTVVGGNNKLVPRCVRHHGKGKATFDPRRHVYCCVSCHHVRCEQCIVNEHQPRFAPVMLRTDSPGHDLKWWLESVIDKKQIEYIRHPRFTDVQLRSAVVTASAELCTMLEELKLFVEYVARPPYSIIFRAAPGSEVNVGKLPLSIRTAFILIVAAIRSIAPHGGSCSKIG